MSVGLEGGGEVQDKSWAPFLPFHSVLWHQEDLSAWPQLALALHKYKHPRPGCLLWQHSWPLTARAVEANDQNLLYLPQESFACAVLRP